MPPFVLLEDRASIDAAGRLFTHPVEVVRSTSGKPTAQP